MVELRLQAIAEPCCQHCSGREIVASCNNSQDDSIAEPVISSGVIM